MKRYNRRARSNNHPKAIWNKARHLARRRMRIDRLYRAGFDASWLHSPYASAFV